MLSRKKEHLTALLAGMVLVTYIAFLLIANYLSQIELRRSSQDQLKQEMEKRAAALSYFASERANDLKGLAAGKELAYFFANKALGMSMKYGLSANLEDIAGSFDRLIDQKKLGEDQIYSRIDFIGYDKEMHVSRTTNEGPSITPEELDTLLEKEKSETGITLQYQDQFIRMVFFMPYYFKDIRVGRIVTWVDVKTIYRHFIQESQGPSRRVFYIGYESLGLTLPVGKETQIDPSKLPDLKTIPYGELIRFNAALSYDSSTIDAIALRVPVDNTPLFILVVMPYEELFGQTNYRGLILLPGALSAIVLVGIGVLLKIRDQNLILNIRLDESTKRQEEIANKNLQLRKEIAEREEIEGALRSSEKKYRKLHESMREGFVSVGLDGMIAECNSAFLEMLGYTQEMIYNLSYDALTPPKWRAAEAEIIKTQVMVRGYSDIYEKEFRRKDNTTLPVELRAYLLTDETGKATGTWAILRDITDRKQAEEELRGAKDAAESANRAKSEFLANMSHELRTPLHQVIGFIELLLYGSCGDLNEKQKRYLDRSFESGQHLLALINDILDISKVEAGKTELSLSTIQIKPLIENSLIMITESVIKDGLSLSTDIGDIPETITADERKLKQIVYNLLANAAKFTPSGGCIHFSANKLHSDGNGRLISSSGKPVDLPADETARGKGSGEFMEISVKDTGIGIKADDLERIFQPFEQLESSMSRKYQGTGLGLALTKKFVELHGGRIWAESEGEGKGCEFHIVIPA